MNKKHQIYQILEIKQRAGRHSPSADEVSRRLEQLRQILKQNHDSSTLKDFIPIRIATCIEVIVRAAVRQLVDTGSPYSERAEKFAKSIKFDFFLAHAIHGKSITLGDIVGNNISTNSLNQILSVFETLLSQNFNNDIRTVSRRYDAVLYGNNQPIIKNPDDVFKKLSDVFDIRHILVHEIPAKCPYDEKDLEGYIDAADQFSIALDELIAQKLHGDYPVFQSEMTQAACRHLDVARLNLSRTIRRLRKIPFFNRPDFLRAQKAWKAFCNAEATLHAAEMKGGSAEPMIFAGVQSVLTEERTKQILEWLERAEKND